MPLPPDIFYRIHLSQHPHRPWPDFSILRQLASAGLCSIFHGVSRRQEIRFVSESPLIIINDNRCVLGLAQTWTYYLVICSDNDLHLGPPTRKVWSIRWTMSVGRSVEATLWGPRVADQSSMHYMAPLGVRFVSIGNLLGYQTQRTFRDATLLIMAGS